MVKEELLEGLVKKHNLNEPDITRLKTEAEITRLRVEFAAQKSQEEKIPFYDSLIKYAALNRFTKGVPKDQMERLEHHLKDLKEVDDDVIENVSEELFLKSDYTKGICERHRPKSCFSYTIWDDQGANLHFTNAVIPKNPFKGEEYEKRKDELKAIARDIKENHPEVKYIFEVSWIRNLKAYQSLMPPESTVQEWTEHEFYSMGHWGQFYRSDGTLNSERVKKFRKTWEFPVKVLLGECDIKSFFDMYL